MLPKVSVKTVGGIANVVGKQGKQACGQSYKASMIVNYDSRVIIWGIFKSGTTLES